MDLIILGAVVGIISLVFSFMLFKHKITILEGIVLFIAPIFIAFISSLIGNYSIESDVEYLGDLVTDIKYYEPYEYWKEETCIEYYDCNCTTDSLNIVSCETCERDVDCSRCVYVSEKYRKTGISGDTYSINESEYNRIKRKFGTTEINKGIRRRLSANEYYLGCGKEGYYFEVKWDGDKMKCENATYKHYYKNKVVKAPTLYKERILKGNELKRVFSYPKVNNSKQSAIIGNFKGAGKLEQRIEYFNGKYGSELQIKIFVIRFKGNDNDIFELQRQHFKNGNKNEFIFIFNDEKADVITWTEVVSLRNYVFDTYAQTNDITETVLKTLPKLKTDWVRREFTPLNDIAVVNLPYNYYITTLIINLILSIIISYIFGNNPFNSNE